MRLVAKISVSVLGLIAANAAAQTSNCTSIGGGMVHCDHQGGGWTDCNSVGGTMATCNTMGVPDRSQPQAQYEDYGRAQGGSVASLIGGIRERSFRAKVGKMLSAGDCSGAAKFALEKGRLELGSAIQQACNSASRPPMASAAPTLSGSVHQVLQQAAARAVTPAALDANTTIIKVEAEGDQLTFSVSVKDTSLFTDQWRSGIVRQLCDPNGIGALVQRGATIRAEFQDGQDKALGAMSVTANSCR